MNYPDIDALTNHTIQEKHIKKYYPEFYEYLRQNFPNILWKEKIYCFYHDLPEPPKCPVCGNSVKFISFFEGYHRCCSKKCMYKDPLRSQKIINTQRERYGGVGFESKELMDKTKKTNLERYGVEQIFTSNEIRDKIKQTNIERYGVENPMQNKEINQKGVNTQRERYGGVGFESKELMDKTKKTNLERYGYENNFASKEKQQEYQQLRIERYGNPFYNNREKAKQTMINKYGVPNNMYLYSDTIIDCIPNENYEFKRKCPHLNCNECQEKFYWADPFTYSTRKQFNREPCTRLLPIDRHLKNTSIELFIHRILDKYHIEYIINDHKILNGKELDIYIPSKSLAIECNGVYWHSIECISPKDELYHFNKWKGCKDNGIELLTFWDYQIYETPELVEDIILKKLGIKEIQYDDSPNTYIASNDFDFIPPGYKMISIIPPEKHNINGHTFYDCGKTIYQKM